MEGTFFEGEIGKEIKIGALKASINLIPVIGPFLSEAFFETPNRIAQKRNDAYIYETLKKLQNIQAHLIDTDYLQSEDFVDLFQHTAAKVIARKAKDRA